MQSTKSADGQSGHASFDRGGSATPSPKVILHGIRRLAAPLIGLALLARGLRRPSVGGRFMALAGSGLLYRGVTGRPRLSQVIGDLTRRGAGRHHVGAPADAPEIARTITIGKPAEELYRLWRDPQTMSQVMGHFADVTAAGEGRARWSVRAPLGQTLEWETRLVDDRPGELVRWASAEDASIPNEGEVRFRPGPADWGTEVSLLVRFDPPGGPLGDAAAKLTGLVPKLAVGKALRRFKSLAETGEIPVRDQRPSAPDTSHND